jgi:hypothetical protein
MARPERWRAVGEVLLIRAVVSWSSDWSSKSRRDNCVVQKSEMDIGESDLGGIFIVGSWSCGGVDVEVEKIY